MVDLKNEPAATPKKSKHVLSMTTVKNWFMSDKKQQDAPFRQRMPESFLRSIRRRSLRVKRTKSLVLPEKRKSDSFVNSQEWTLSRSVPDVRLGIVGSLSSGKSALVHRYLTGSYMQEESPEGGRFKKEILVDNQSYLLLIRDEGGTPELQFTAWVDAVIFVFSLENENSFNAIYNYYTKMSHYRNVAEIPLILVGTQDAISENNPRVIDESRARKLANDLKRCSYYETCATYGLNVERVFQDACQKIVQQRLSTSATCLTPTNSRPSTPNFHPPGGPLTVPRHLTTSNNGFSTQQQNPNHMSPSHNHTLSHKDSMALSQMGGRQVHTLSASSHHLHRQSEKHDGMLRCDEKWNSSSSTLGSHGSSQALLIQTIPTENNNVAKFAAPHPLDNTQQQQQPAQISKDKDLPTPSSTPTTSRKSRRRSNLFTPSKKADDKLKNGGDIGVGRAIPLKQGYLYKRSSKPLNKEWKKKYVTLCDDGRLTYHPSLHDYMDDVHGKEISLQYVTVKVPGQKPRGSKSIITVAPTNGHTINEGSKDKRLTEKVLLTAFEMSKDSGKCSQVSGDEGMFNSNSFLNGDSLKTETPNVKKRHRRMKSSGVKNAENDDGDGYEFYIVSLDNKQWNFEATSSEERDEWVTAIEQQILNSLQLNESSKAKKQNNPLEAETIQTIRTRVPGNTYCVDCDAPNPDWASLNLGVLMCIECSGIHRNLGSHISKVRSLNLDEWPPGHLSVMLAVGNNLANSIFEYRTQGERKPDPSSSREDKERWIRAKYENKEFLPPLCNMMSIEQQLIDSVCASNVKSIVQILAQATTEQVNTTVGPRDLRSPLHLACAMGNLAVAQLLIWHNANVKAIDQDGRTCLTYAKAAYGIAISKQPQQTGNNSANSDASLAACKSLIELLIISGCPETTSVPGSGTLPRRRGSQALPSFEKVTSSVI
ncbi:PREDICTED: centaurin-gamma-1A isoform X2 [Nicrophorus vespilloides]|uniref:Centaurin-gamma-1A isoform X2 n=1 Tax=Nicrophorus vespilloides TaxID=110193 RepID=A0ABM1M3Y2_NICVS|nr:PREDICTED: centaurin-gamma-1A isoform X2 [Nicrophorus vespilloides]